MRRIRSHVTGIAATAALVSTLMLGQTVSAALGEEGATGWRDAEVPAAGLKLKIPAAWDDSVVPDAEPEPVELPDAYEDASPATSKALYAAYTFDATSSIWCELAAYEDMPLSLQEHADWHEQLITTAPGFTGLALSQPFDLPIGEAIRVDSGYLTGEQQVRYLFDFADTRFHLDCEADWTDMPEDGWLEMARSIEPLAEAVSEQGETDAVARSIDAKAVTGFWDYAWVVPAGHPTFPTASLMWSWCDIAVWLEAEDGSATEWKVCSLSDEPWEPADQQGEPPAEVVAITGGPCGVSSSYWWTLEQRDVFASSFEITVTPSGQVVGRADFPSEPLLCDD